jgi:hypothetical protein
LKKDSGQAGMTVLEKKNSRKLLKDSNGFKKQSFKNEN